MGDGASEDRLAERLVAELRSPRVALGEELVQASRELRAALVSTTELPWTVANTDETRKLIAEFERRTSVIADGLAAVVAYDVRLELLGHARLTVTSLLGDFNPSGPGVTISPLARSLRRFPVVLLAYVGFSVGAIFERPEFLHEISRSSVPTGRLRGSLGLVDCLGYFREAGDAFNELAGGRRCEPIGERVRQFVHERLSALLGFVDLESILPVGEFLVALAGVDNSLGRGRNEAETYPIPGLFFYDGGSEVHAFLERHPEWIQGVYDHPIEDLLRAFDASVGRLMRFECGPQDLLDGRATLASWTRSGD